MISISVQTYKEQELERIKGYYDKSVLYHRKGMWEYNKNNTRTALMYFDKSKLYGDKYDLALVAHKDEYYFMREIKRHAISKEWGK